MFDTVTGLPVHALIVHAVVVGMPVMALLTIAVAARAGWRRWAGPVLLGDLAVLAVTFVARESGENLRARLIQLSPDNAALTERHADLGTLMPLFALGLVVAALAVWLAHRRGGVLVAVGLVLSLAAGVAAIGWTVLVGDSGARAVWEQTVANTKAP